MNNDEKFDEIVQDFLHQMEIIRCPVNDYVVALKMVIDEINIAIRAVWSMPGDEL